MKSIHKSRNRFIILSLVVPVILLLAGAATVRYPSVICSGICLLSLAGLVIFNGRDFFSELGKKFHI